MIEGYIEANTLDDPSDKNKLSEEDADELWAWMEERQKADPIPLTSGQPLLSVTTVDA